MSGRLRAGGHVSTCSLDSLVSVWHTREVFVKLYGSILTSSVWVEPDNVRLLWIAMLALADADGHVAASIPGLANVARLSVDDTAQALAVLEAPDKHDRSGVNEGRRLAKVQGGWNIVNHRRYRDVRSPRQLRAAAHMREVREREKLTREIVSADADADADADHDPNQVQLADITPADAGPARSDPRMLRAAQVWREYEPHRVHVLGGRERKPSPAKLAKVCRQIIALTKHVRDTEGCDEETSWERVIDYGKGAVIEAAHASGPGADRLAPWRGDWNEWRTTRYDQWAAKASTTRKPPGRPQDSTPSYFREFAD